MITPSIAATIIVILAFNAFFGLCVINAMIEDGEWFVLTPHEQRVAALKWLTCALPILFIVLVCRAWKRRNRRTR